MSPRGRGKDKGKGKKEVKQVADRERALDMALASIERQYGKGAVMRLGEKSKVQGQIGVIPTGSLGLDVALGIGGYPRGRVVEIYGPEASGKTTLALHAIAEAQKIKGIALFIDAEHALDISYARKLGVNVDDLLIHQPDNGEQALEVADTMVRSNAVDVIVVDSVAALTPRAELEGEMGDSHVGLQARLMSQAMRKLAANVAKSRTLLVFINQIRMKIGVMFGSPETTTGGNALKFYSSQRLDIRRIATIKHGDTVTGGRARVKVVKNKLSPPFRESEFDIVYGLGINRLGELVDLGVKIGAIEKTGAWFSMSSALGSERVGQGRDNAVAFFQDNPDLAEKVDLAIRQKAGLPTPKAPEEPEAG
jgi:recombination protein RecA